MLQRRLDKPTRYQWHALNDLASELFLDDYTTRAFPPARELAQRHEVKPSQNDPNLTHIFQKFVCGLISTSHQQRQKLACELPTLSETQSLEALLYKDFPKLETQDNAGDSLKYPELFYLTSTGSHTKKLLHPESTRPQTTEIFYLTSTGSHTKKLFSHGKQNFLHSLSRQLLFRHAEASTRPQTTELFYLTSTGTQTTKLLRKKPSTSLPDKNLEGRLYKDFRELETENNTWLSCKCGANPSIKLGDRYTWINVSAWWNPVGEKIYQTEENKIWLCYWRSPVALSSLKLVERRESV